MEQIQLFKLQLNSTSPWIVPTLTICLELNKINPTLEKFQPNVHV